MDIKCSILDTREVKKNDKTYYLVKLWLNFSDVVYTVFVSKETLYNISTGVIASDNLINYLHFRVDSSGKFSVSIY